jgi:Uma2 family endonuclease
MVTWAKLCEDKRFQDLPYKVETNKRGLIMMSPARGKHGYYQSEISYLLRTLLPNGSVIVECPVETEDGTRVPDVAWMTKEKWNRLQDEISFSECPEICVEVQSPSNSEEETFYKRDLLLAKGCQEFWLCSEQGALRFFCGKEEIPGSGLCPDFPLSIS